MFKSTSVCVLKPASFCDRVTGKGWGGGGGGGGNESVLKQTHTQKATDRAVHVLDLLSSHLNTQSAANRQFPEITGEDNLTVFSYSGRVKSPEWRRQQRRADLRQF